MDYCRKADRVLKGLIQSGRKRFVIFPFGERGRQVKQILNQQYGIMEEYIVDNGLSGGADNPDMISLAELKKADLDGMVILLSSDQESVYSQLRCQLLEL